MRIAILVSDKTHEWAGSLALVIEQQTGLHFDVKPGKEGIFLVPQTDAGTPSEALAAARRARDSMTGFGDTFVRPLYLWSESGEPRNVEDAFVELSEGVIAFERRLSSITDQERSHPMSGGFAIDRS